MQIHPFIASPHGFFGPSCAGRSEFFARSCVCLLPRTESARAQMMDGRPSELMDFALHPIFPDSRPERQQFVECFQRVWMEPQRGGQSTAVTYLQNKLQHVQVARTN